MKYKACILSFFIVLTSILFFNSRCYSFPQSQQDLEYIAEHLVFTGIDSNNLQPLVNPEFTTVSLASMALDENDIVFIVATGSLKPLQQRSHYFTAKNHGLA